AGTVGFPLSGVELKITDPETGKALPKGEIGLIEVRGENVFQGYWNMPEKTKEDLREDGFFITGDLAKYDADGYVTIVGRQKDLIISGGFNVYPKEIETVLDDQADVKESAVVGLEHPDFGEGVVAFVVMQEWAAVNEDQLIAALGQELAKYKTPKRIIALEELPRNTMGKVQKNVLRDGYRELFLN
ncbi:MAG: AMP-binding enzyme, partial [Paracoccaceae bacterium]